MTRKDITPEAVARKWLAGSSILVIATLPAVLEPVPTLLPPQKTQTPKGVSGTRGVTCDGCGKVFKHESALAGHSWVHLPGRKGGRRVGSKQPRVDD